jgi:ankyrin repeat protein
LHWAAEGGNADVVRLLLEAGADVNPTTADGTTPLGAVVDALEDEKGKPGHIEVVSLLLGKGAHQGLGIKCEDNLKQWLLSTGLGEAFQDTVDRVGASGDEKLE